MHLLVFFLEIMFIIGLGVCFGKLVNKPTTEIEKMKYHAKHLGIYCMMLIIFYFLVITVCSLLASLGDIWYRMGGVVISSLLIGFAYKVLCELIKDLSNFPWKKEKYYVRVEFWIILFCLFIILLIASSLFNYVVYILVPGGFALEDSTLNDYAVGFEFIYYSFTLVITYSGSSGIEAVSICTKTVQMLEILVFYVIFGSKFVELLEPSKENA